MKSKLRYFYSKGAFLVLVWIMLITSAMTFLNHIFIKSVSITSYPHINDQRLLLLPIIAFIPIAGWLADVRYGNFKVFKFGALLFFVSTVLTCICLIMSIEAVHPTVIGITSTAAVLVAYLGVSACVVTALQLGLDQMPDASSDNIISFIKWLMFSIFFGVWISDIILKSTIICASVDPDNRFIFFSLYPVLVMSILCCSIFLLAPKWLIFEPKSPQSLKIIYQVLKFAAKHKSPLNRSALTYWEEDVPSRMDLGKSRYGGPFTTEQVEDVKTFFKIIVIQIPLFFVLLSSQKFNVRLDHQAPLSINDECTASLISLFTYHPFFGAMLVTLISEFIVYPLVKIEPPSMLKQIGFACFIIVVANIGILSAEVVSYFHDIQTWIKIASSIIGGLVQLSFLTNSIMLFACAQSPYNMRGLLVGFALLLHVSSLILGELLFRIIVNLCYNYIIYSSVMVVVTLFGFILYCLLARWYKRRVRDEEYNVHRVVEEVYDRYLSNDMYH